MALLLPFAFMNSTIIYDFNKKSSTRDWRVIDDGVMGGMSQGRISINSEGNGVFEGTISLENNGGFSSIRYGFDKIKVNPQSTVSILVKGDGKSDQFRIKDKYNNYYSYITTFETTGEWQTVELKLSDLYPSFRGRKLDLPNFRSDSFDEIVFLIANKRNETFKLTLDKISLN